MEMSDRKTGRAAVAEHTVPFDGGDEDDPDFYGTKSTDEDKIHMNRLGKQQQLVVCPTFFESRRHARH